MDVEWFKSKKKERRVTDAALAAALGVERSVANKVVNGRVAINVRRIGAVAELLGVAADELMFRTGLSADAPAALPVRIADQPATRSADAGETAPVTRLDLSYSMGPGTDLDASYVDGEPFEFDIGFLRGLTITPPERLRIVDGIGDSMQPTLHDRDLLFVDINQRELNAQDRIWAISLFGAGAVKRLKVVGNDRVLVVSDNKEVGDQEVDRSDIRIHGRVIGSIKRH
jgi:phage repressor protein C with HTH and peptisase S24 domain